MPRTYKGTEITRGFIISEDFPGLTAGEKAILADSDSLLDLALPAYITAGSRDSGILAIQAVIADAIAQADGISDGRAIEDATIEAEEQELVSIDAALVELDATMATTTSTVIASACRAESQSLRARQEELRGRAGRRAWDGMQARYAATLTPIVQAFVAEYQAQVGTGEHTLFNLYLDLSALDTDGVKVFTNYQMLSVGSRHCHTTRRRRDSDSGGGGTAASGEAMARAEARQAYKKAQAQASIIKAQAYAAGGHTSTRMVEVDGTRYTGPELVDKYWPVYGDESTAHVNDKRFRSFANTSTVTQKLLTRLLLDEHHVVAVTG